MAITVVCSQCGRRFRANESLAGKKVKCSGCGAAIEVTAPEQPVTPWDNLGFMGPAAVPPPPARPNQPGTWPQHFQTPGFQAPGNQGPALPIGQIGPATGPSGNTGRNYLVLGLAIGGAVATVAVLIGVVVVLSLMNRPNEVVAAPPSNAAPYSRSTTPQPNSISGNSIPGSAIPAQQNTRTPADPRTPQRPDTAPPNTTSSAAKEPVPAPPAARSSGEVPLDESQVSVRIPTARNSSHVVMASASGPFLAADLKVFDVRTGRSLGEFRHKFERYSAAVVLSPDGQTMASVESGKSREALIQTLGGSRAPIRVRGERAESVRFLDNDRLLVAHNKSVSIVDVKSGRNIKQFALEETPDQYSLGCQGKYLAFSDFIARTPVVYDADRGIRIAKMENPNGDRHVPKWDALAFSPDSQELAGLSEEGLVCWSLRGKVVYNVRFIESVKLFPPHPWHLYYLPENNGWLVGGKHLLLRDARQIVWSIEPPFPHDTHPAMLLDQKHVLVARERKQNRAGPGSSEFIDLPIPWSEINAALGAGSKAEALLKSGDALSLRLEVAAVQYSDASEVQRNLLAALTKRMQQLSIPVQPGQPLTLLCRYAERPGPTRKVVDRFRQETGTSVTTTVGTFHAWIVMSGTDQVVWQRTLSSDGGLVTFGEVNEQSVRDDMYKSILGQISQLPVPDFIPKNASDVQLPLKTKL